MRCTLLGELIKRGELERLSVSISADPTLLESVAGRYGVTPFLRSCVEGQLEILKFLVARSCNIKAVDVDLYSGPHLAAHSGHLEVLKFLYQIGPFLFNRATIEGDNPLIVACKNRHLHCANWLIDKCDVNAQNHAALNALAIAALNGWKEFIKELVEKGACITQIIYEIHLSAKDISYIRSCQLWSRIKGISFSYKYDQFLQRFPFGIIKEIFSYL